MREYQRNIYVFISDENRKFLRATQGANGVYTVARSTQPYPVSYNPTNMNLSEIEIKTNDEYFSPTRFVTGQYEFVKDAAAILRDLYYNGKGSEQKCYMTVISWNGDAGIYELSLYGRLDLSMKSEDEKKSSFSCNVIDDSAWGNLSVNDDVEYSIECNQRNPKAIRVLLDGINLYNKITYQTVQAPIIHLSEPNWFTMPFVLAAQDGDSVGLILQSQSLLNQPYVALGVGVGDVFPGEYFLKSITGTPNVRFSGSISLIPQINDPDTQLMGDITIMFVSSKGKMHGIFSNTELAGQNPPPIYEVPAHWDLVAGQTYTEEFDFSWDLEPDESVYLTAIVSDTPHPDRMFGFTPIVTNISVGTKTIPEPRIVYAVRPLDIAKELVKKATNGRFTINSSFFEENNKNVVTSGDALRGIQNSMIYTTFKDFFKAYNSLEFLALVTVGGELRIEKAVDVYSGDNEIIDLGDAISLELIPAKQYYCNKISVGCKTRLQASIRKT
ncbi:MAG: hypothetical protein IPI98_02675 [Chitinophagaceae bacterium]|nr:hypothetical protein [Chitinophagaceae bacterium]